MVNQRIQTKRNTVTPETLRVLLKKSHDATDELAKMYFSKHPVSSVEEEIRIRFLCQRDTAHHFEYLINSVRAGKETLFTDYIRWLKSVLQSRKQDTAHVEDALRYEKIGKPPALPGWQ